MFLTNIDQFGSNYHFSTSKFGGWLVIIIAGFLYSPFIFGFMEERNLSMVLFGSMLAIFGFYNVTRNDSLVLNPKSKEYKLTRGSLWNSETQTGKYSDIKGLKIEKRLQRTNERTNQTNHQFDRAYSFYYDVGFYFHADIEPIFIYSSKNIHVAQNALSKLSTKLNISMDFSNQNPETSPESEEIEPIQPQTSNHTIGITESKTKNGYRILAQNPFSRLSGLFTLIGGACTLAIYIVIILFPNSNLFDATAAFVGDNVPFTKNILIVLSLGSMTLGYIRMKMKIVFDLNHDCITFYRSIENVQLWKRKLSLNKIRTFTLERSRSKINSKTPKIGINVTKWDLYVNHGLWRIALVKGYPLNAADYLHKRFTTHWEQFSEKEEFEQTKKKA